MKPLNIFIGFDQAEAIAYGVLCQSIINTASVPVSFTPVKRSMLPFHTRERDPKQSNEFSFTRFLVPYLSGYEGVSLFMDCDMLVTRDIKELFDEFDERYAVQVVKHDYTPSTETKYLGNIQHKYARKNWSSVMLFNNYKCRQLRPDYVNSASGLDLHQFAWLEDEEIGDLPPEWNYLVNETKNHAIPKNIHYTLGTPCFKDYMFCEYADEWYKVRSDLIFHKERG